VLTIKRRFFILLLILILLSGCSKSDEKEPPDVTIPPKIASEIEPEPLPKKPEDEPAKPEELILPELAVNNLTGLYTDDETAGRRPVAVVINNLHKALPQSGISKADLYYEVLAEADITRIVAFFNDFSSQKIGPVRSTRDYFTDFALDNDAIFVHHGGSPAGYAFIKSRGINAIDGMTDGKTFWRDPQRVAIRGMYEHSSYTSGERILTAIEERGFRTELSAGYSLFDFYDGFTLADNGPAFTSVTIPFSKYQSPVFTYDSANGVFLRSQADGPHTDEETGEQISVANIIIQFTSMRVIDNEGRREVDVIDAGEGYLITGGRYIPITWKKTSHEAPTEYYEINGDKLRVNKGKTWICILQDTAEPVFE